jgi:hypothetical protein
MWGVIEDRVRGAMGTIRGKKGGGRLNQTDSLVDAK